MSERVKGGIHTSAKDLLWSVPLMADDLSTLLQMQASTLCTNRGICNVRWRVAASLYGHIDHVPVLWCDMDAKSQLLPAKTATVDQMPTAVSTHERCRKWQGTNPVLLTGGKQAA